MIQRPRLTKEVARTAKDAAVRYDLRDAANGVAGQRLTVFPSGIKTWSLRWRRGTGSALPGMRDRELHFGNRRTWILPAPRTKNHHEHEILLTDAMIETFT